MWRAAPARTGAWISCIRLMQTSASNDVLSALVGLDILTGGRMVFITVQDLLARDIFVCPQSWLIAAPDHHLCARGV